MCIVDPGVDYSGRGSCVADRLENIPSRLAGLYSADFLLQHYVAMDLTERRLK